jgi:hypothetical protein
VAVVVVVVVAVVVMCATCHPREGIFTGFFLVDV